MIGAHGRTKQGGAAAPAAKKAAPAPKKAAPKKGAASAEATVGFSGVRSQP